VIVCTNCGYENKEGTAICVKCGTPIGAVVEQTTRSLGDTDIEEGTPRWGSARFNGKMNLIIEAVESGQQFVFDAERVNEVILGRRDPDTGDQPHVDLTEAGALENGVSRKHAVIVRREGSLHIMDYASANGTYLNGQKLVAQQPRILRDGDDIRLGHLVIRVNFQPG
jgi:hypothetical protein